MIDVSTVNQLLQVVGDIRAEIVTARRQLADRQVVVADVVQNQALNVVDVVDTSPLQLGLHEFEELAMQSLDQEDALVVRVLHQPLLQGPCFLILSESFTKVRITMLSKP